VNSLEIALKLVKFLTQVFALGLDLLQALLCLCMRLNVILPFELIHFGLLLDI